ncbi:RlpA-like double-psi beta-barrel-protein domain-containing protein-containing protein [Cytidiella melzeri]|nr:RlpA-like double-psi beta-barrel-protein domain-containing protein-containing protein [Cytidiella melzeri]
MFNLISVASLALSAIVAVTGSPLHRDTIVARHAVLARDATTYDSAILEPYDEYIARYWAIGCPTQHDTPFFDSCCHPMKKGETLAANREPQCNPANLSSAVSSAASTATASSATPTATDDDGDCDDDEETTSAAPTPSATSSHVLPPATSSAAPAPVNAAPAPPQELSSSSVAPVETSSTHVTTTKALTSTKAAPSPTPTAASTDFTGQGTWFTQNGVAGACGTVHPDSAMIVALDSAIYNNGENCGRSLTITNESNGKSQKAVVADECPTCVSAYSVDFSEALFEALAGDLGIGEIKISWHFD